MTGTPAFPRLALARIDSPFHEAVIEIEGHEEKTIRVDGPGVERFAARLVAVANGQAALLNALTGAIHALRSYEFGNGAPDLARSIADHCETIVNKHNRDIAT